MVQKCQSSFSITVRNITETDMQLKFYMETLIYRLRTQHIQIPYYTPITQFQIFPKGPPVNQKVLKALYLDSRKVHQNSVIEIRGSLLMLMSCVNFFYE